LNQDALGEAMVLAVSWASRSRDPKSSSEFQGQDESGLLAASRIAASRLPPISVQALINSMRWAPLTPCETWSWWELVSRLLVAIPFPFFPRLGDEVFEFCCS